jgi:S-DNA-T family DNA segregation ATPase FtsK/SpoIIIE
VRRSTIRHELAGIVLSMSACFLLAALLFPGVTPTGSSCLRAHAFMGPTGACLRSGLVYVFGLPAALLFPLAAAAHALRLLGRADPETDRSWQVFFVGTCLLLPVALAHGFHLGPVASDLAGLWGAFAAFYVDRAFGSGGTWLLLLLAWSVLTALTLAWNPIRLLIHGWRRPVQLLSSAVRVGAERTSALRAAFPQPDPDEMPGLDPALVAEVLQGREMDPTHGERDGADDAPRLAADTEERPVLARLRRRKARGADADPSVVIPAGEDVSADRVVFGSTELPSTGLLDAVPPPRGEASVKDIEKMGTRLMDALATYKVSASLVGRTTGPTVTQFEVEPAAGVKVKAFANLENDLALAMRASSIRIVAPIPGRGVVGIEVPNPVAEMVGLRELLESTEFQTARAVLPIALGKDIAGLPVIADLAKMPHLLIAGTTGSGKSVCMNTIITSLVYRHTPETLRLLMIDPKMVELNIYSTLPHLRHKVVIDNKDAASVFKWAVLEMQDRYALLAANHCRNLQDFNQKVLAGTPLHQPPDPHVGLPGPLPYTGGVLPYIVVCCDELADLMMTVQAEVETPIAMLAQKARAIGIHLILATQRPSVNVVTGLIKSNFPSRIAFRVPSAIDSRTILDGPGAELLLGNGDMLFIPPGRSEPSRLQGAFVSTEATERLIAWYTEQRESKRASLAAQGFTGESQAEMEADILERVRQFDAEGHGADGTADAGERDPRFLDAAQECVKAKNGSTSLLQRKLGIGYGRAARIMDQLQDAGVLGPANGAKGRDVLVDLDEAERIARV